MSIICGMKRRRERCSQDRGTERDLWAREQVRKETRKGKSLRPLPNEETRTVRENGSGNHRERLTSLPVLAHCAVLSFSERPDRTRTPIPQSLQWLSTALCL